MTITHGPGFNDFDNVDPVKLAAARRAGFLPPAGPTHSGRAHLTPGARAVVVRLEDSQTKIESARTALVAAQEEQVRLMREAAVGGATAETIVEALGVPAYEVYAALSRAGLLETQAAS